MIGSLDRTCDLQIKLGQWRDAYASFRQSLVLGQLSEIKVVRFSDQLADGHGARFCKGPAVVKESTARRGMVFRSTITSVDADCLQAIVQRTTIRARRGRQ